MTKQRLILAMITMAGCATDENVDAPDPATVADPAALPGYVRTPAGFMHQSCVHELAPDAIAREDGTVQHADGTVETVPACAYPHFAVRAPGAAGHAPTVNGWVEDAWRYASNGYKQFTAEWHVPPAPAAAGGLIYFFPGFEPDDGSRILQPVLQYGSNGMFGGNYWTIASWNCGGGSSCFHSAPFAVNVNDDIHGWITGSSCSNGICNWAVSTKDSTTGAFTQLTWQAHVRYTWGFVALEAYDVTSCAQYPAGGSMWMLTSVWRTDGSLANSSWGSQNLGASPGCGYNVVPYGDLAAGLYY